MQDNFVYYDLQSHDEVLCLCVRRHANLTRLSLKNLNVTNPVLRLPYLRTLEIVNVRMSLVYSL